ncbi:hypothetical protein [Nostoc sp.]|uniref:hypothetical protein n=1 Tax=Nostoc sp. TaxID=1180 RepID=UPI003FA60168
MKNNNPDLFESREYAGCNSRQARANSTVRKSHRYQPTRHQMSHNQRSKQSIAVFGFVESLRNTKNIKEAIRDYHLFFVFQQALLNFSLIIAIACMTTSLSAGASTAAQKSKVLYSKLLRHFEWYAYLRHVVLAIWAWINCSCSGLSSMFMIYFSKIGFSNDFISPNH